MLANNCVIVNGHLDLRTIVEEDGIMDVYQSHLLNNSIISSYLNIRFVQNLVQTFRDGWSWLYLRHRQYTVMFSVHTNIASAALPPTYTLVVGARINIDPENAVWLTKGGSSHKDKLSEIVSNFFNYRYKH